MSASPWGPERFTAWLGRTGVGKSTLMNILFGMPVITNTGGYEGTVLINGESVAFDSPRCH